MENISYASTCEESATDAKAVKAPSWTICLPF